MEVILSHAAAIAYRTLDDDNRRRVDAWVRHLSNWETDLSVQKESHLLALEDNANSNTYILRTSTDLRIFFVLHADHIELIDIARRDTMREFAEASQHAD
jgi:hypothetical protein